MLLRPLLAAMLVAAPIPSAPQQPDMEQVVPLVDCISSRGSAVRIGPHLLVTARHVINSGQCYINGKPVKVLYKADPDYALISTEDEGPFIKVDCGGIHAGQHIYASGHARGLPFLTTIRLVGAGANGGFALLWGIFTVIPGMSGGSMVDADTGKLVGLVNWYEPQKGISGSAQLKDTIVCSKS